MKNINKKNYFKLLLLGLITPLLCGVSFAFDLTSDEITYLNNNAINQGSFSNVSYYDLYDRGTASSSVIDLCVIFSGFTFTNPSKPYYEIIASASAVPSSSSYFNNGYATYPYFLFCRGLVDVRYLVLRSSSDTRYSTNFNVDKFWVLPADKITNGYLGFDVQGLLDNYNNCQSDLNNCDTITSQCIEDKNTLSGQLAICNADKVSLNNNIDSLTLQLQNCLGQSCGGSGDIGSGSYFNQYSLYWTDDETDYSTPITNNLFLPLGYKGKINEDNILSISKINTLETAYQFSESDKPVVINSMGFVMLFFLGTGLLIVVIMYLRRFISKK